MRSNVCAVLDQPGYLGGDRLDHEQFVHALHVMGSILETAFVTVTDVPWISAV